MRDEAIVVFARAPELGRVKTRLASALGEKRTLELYRAFLADTLESARATGAHTMLAHTKADPAFDEQHLADECILQPEGTFGERFDHALASASKRASRTILVGADSPHVGPAVMRDALTRLRHARAVLGPGTEGGFYLFGARSPIPPIAATFDASNESAAIAGLLAPELLAPSFDVDVPRDVVGLVLHLETLQAAGAWAPRRTVAALQALGIRVARAASGSRERVLVLD